MGDKVRIIDDIGLREKYYIKNGDLLPVVRYDDPARYAEKFEPKRAGCMVDIGAGQKIHLASYEYEPVDET
jgi:hypothetical protein